MKTKDTPTHLARIKAFGEIPIPTVRQRMGHNLYLLRRKKGFGQVEFARAIGISQSNISKVETGILELSLGMAMKAKKVLKCSIYKLTEGDNL